MKHFIDIQAMRESVMDLGGGVIRPSNTGAFEIGDEIYIENKLDGANGSVKYDPETDRLLAFSRKKELDEINTNRGFWNYVQKLDPAEFRKHPNWTVYGEWEIPHAIRTYREDVYKEWHVYDIWDSEAETWLHQETVRKFCKSAGLKFINVLYHGEFKGWDHVRQFSYDTTYGPQNEGVVIKNMTKLADAENREPAYIKIVNDEFKETKAEVSDAVKKEKEEAHSGAEQLLTSVVTPERVRKEILKMVDEGILPEEITPQQMGVVAKNLPKRIFNDCLKEEPEIIEAAGEYAGKICSSLTMKIAKEILLG